MSEPTADLVLHNGATTTLDPARPHARALAAGGGTIIAVGGTTRPSVAGAHTPG